MKRILSPVSYLAILLFLPPRIWAEMEPPEKSWLMQKSCSPFKAALWGILPGGGHYYCGDAVDGSLHAGFFVASLAIANHYIRQDDFIKPGDQVVTFRPEDYFISRELQQRSLLYTDTSPLMTGNTTDLFLYYEASRRGWINANGPIIGEYNGERDMALLFDRHTFFEVNPLVKYGGSYMRYNADTIAGGLMAESVLWQSEYSIYSAYRDAGGFGSVHRDENYASLALSPFRPRYLLDWRVVLDLLVTGVYINNSRNPFVVPAKTTLVPPGEMYRSDLALVMANCGIGVAVGEEAFFRGVVNRSLIERYGPVPGILSSAAIFSASHSVVGASNWAATLWGGLYYGWLNYDSDYDLGPTIAAHFWSNVIAMAMFSRNIRSDRNAGKTAQEVMFMPVAYSFKF